MRLRRKEKAAKEERRRRARLVMRARVRRTVQERERWVKRELWWVGLTRDSRNVPGFGVRKDDTGEGSISGKPERIES